MQKEQYLGIRSKKRTQRTNYKKLYRFSAKDRVRFESVLSQIESNHIEYLQLGHVFHIDRVKAGTNKNGETVYRTVYRALDIRDFKRISNALEENSSLRSLNLSFIKPFRQIQWDLVQALSKHPNIHTIVLNHYNISTLWKKWISLAKKLKSFDLSHNTLSTKGLNRFAADLIKKSKPCQLEQLVITHNKITTLSDAWILVNQHLKYLNLSHNQINTESAEVLAKSLADPKCSLEYLDLSHNKLGNVEIKIIADAIPLNQSLHTLDLSWNKFNNEAANYLADKFRRSTTLKNMPMNRITVNFIKKHQISKKMATRSLYQFTTSVDAASRLYWNPSSHSYIQKFALKPGLLLHIFSFVGGVRLNTSVKNMQNKAKRLFGIARSPILFTNKILDHHHHEPNKIITKKELTSKDNPITGRFNYVVTRKGKLIIGAQDENPGGGHLDLAQGEPVRNAGEVKFFKGKVKHVDNSAGHYLPYGSNAKKAAITAFKQLKLNVEGKYQEKSWVKDPELPKGGEWKKVASETESSTLLHC